MFFRVNSWIVRVLSAEPKEPTLLRNQSSKFSPSEVSVAVSYADSNLSDPEETIKE